MTVTQEKRIVRLLGMLRRGPASVSIASNSRTLVVRINGERSLRFDQALFDHVIAKGWVAKLQDDGEGIIVIKLTEDGSSYWHRARAGGGHADQQRLTGQVRLPAGDVVMVNHAESPLARLARRTGSRSVPWLDKAQFAAGERLRIDFEHGQLRQKVTMNWDFNGSAGRSNRRNPVGAELSDNALDARQRFERALAAVDPELSGILVDVCCFLKGLEQVEAERQWPRRSAKVLLRVALSALDRHYNPPLPASRVKTRNWGAPGFRPVLST